MVAIPPCEFQIKNKEDTVKRMLNVLAPHFSKVRRQLYRFFFSIEYRIIFHQVYLFFFYKMIRLVSDDITEKDCALSSTLDRNEKCLNPGFRYNTLLILVNTKNPLSPLSR